MVVIMVVIITLIAAVFSALFYRVGGMSKQEAKIKLPWLPQALVNSKTRDWGCSAVALGWMALCYPGALSVAWWAWLLGFGLMWAGLSTYWDFLFGYDNYWVHGWFVGFAFLSFSLATGDWTGMLIRSVVCCVGIGLWSQLTTDVDWEESGRGAIIALTLPLMFVG